MHEINADPEMWELRETFGDRAGFVWLECLSIAGRNEGMVGPDSDQTRNQLASKCRSSRVKVGLVLDWCRVNGWLISDEGLRVAKWGKYNGTREKIKYPKRKNKVPLREETRREETIREEKSKNKTPPSAAFVLPNWIKKITWDGFEEMRKKERHPLTDKARQLIVVELEKLRELGHNPNESLERSIVNSWRGVFPPKESGSGKAATEADLDRILHEMRVQHGKQ